MYKYPWRVFPFAPKKLPIPFVYTCYKQPWKKYASTLYAKVGAHKPIAATTILDRPTLPTELESGKVSLDHVIIVDESCNSIFTNLLSIRLLTASWKNETNEQSRQWNEEYNSNFIN